MAANKPDLFRRVTIDATKWSINKLFRVLVWMQNHNWATPSPELVEFIGDERQPGEDDCDVF